jgi:hypothetical protein
MKKNNDREKNNYSELVHRLYWLDRKSIENPGLDGGRFHAQFEKFLKVGSFRWLIDDGNDRDLFTPNL